jgi:N-acetylmuramoyl-L-alanine amidase
VVCRLQLGAKVTVNLTADGWYRVTANGKTGWVSDQYVKEPSITVSRGDANIRKTASETVSDKNEDKAQEIIDFARKYLGVKYVYGGESPKGFDCSGLTSYVFNNFGFGIPRTAHEQATIGIKVSKSELKPADLIFFDTDGGHSQINHAGIYIGNNRFIHASSSGTNGKKVTISDLDEGFYEETYMTARRLVK